MWRCRADRRWDHERSSYPSHFPRRARDTGFEGHHRFRADEGDVEELWVRGGLGRLAADLTGFGAVSHEAVWDYLDAPHSAALTSVDAEEGELVTDDFAGQYLFFRWLYDAYNPLLDSDGSPVLDDDGNETNILKEIIQGASTGTENIETELTDNTGVSATTEGLMVRFQMALMSMHSSPSGNGIDIDPTDFPPFSHPETIIAPTENPLPQDYYGANGYQKGIDVQGYNYTVEDGTTEDPTVLSAVLMDGADHFNFVYGQDYFGYVAGGYSAQVIRLLDVPFDSTELKISAESSADYATAIVRTETPTLQNYVKENIYSPLDVNSVSLPSLPNNGDPIYALGEITGASYTNVLIDGSFSQMDVYDTDRWSLSLGNYPQGQTVRIAAWLNLKRFPHYP